MAKKELTLILRMKNLAARELHAAGQLIHKFGRGIKTGIDWAAKSFLGLATATALAMKRAEEFAQAAAQVTTLVEIPIKRVKSEVRKLAAEFGVTKAELTKGLYDAVSARIPKENAFEFLRVASKAAVAGAGTAAEAVDILTTTLNAFKIPASEAAKVSDVLFTTVRLGKTTLSELSQNFAIVAPVAAATGVRFEEVAAALATITAQGTPTAEAATQIRQAIIAMNEQLGDGWAKTMTLQQGMVEMARRAGGSQVKLKELTGRVEGMLAILQLTGVQAKGAADDLAEMGKAVGETDRAFAKANPERTLSRVQAALDNIVLTIGDAALEAFGPTLERAARAAGTLAENIAKFMDSEKFKEIAETIDGIIAAIAAGGDRQSQALGALGDVVKAAFAVAVEHVATKLFEIAPKIGHAIGAGFRAAMSSVMERERIAAKAKEMGVEHSPFTRTIGEMGIKHLADRKRVLEAVFADKQREIMEEMGVSGEALANGQSAAQARLDNALAALRKIGMETPRTPGYIPPPPEPQDNKPIAQGAMGSGVVLDAEMMEAAEKRAKEIAELTKDRLELVKDIAEEEKQIAEDQRVDALNNSRNALEDKKREADETARMRVGEFIERKRAEDADKKGRAADAKRAAELWKKQQAGRKLNKADKEFLDAAIAIERAKREGKKLGVDIAQVEADLDKARKARDSANLDQMRANSDKLATQLAALLKAK